MSSVGELSQGIKIVEIRVSWGEMVARVKGESLTRSDVYLLAVVGSLPDPPQKNRDVHLLSSP